MQREQFVRVALCGRIGLSSGRDQVLEASVFDGDEPLNERPLVVLAVAQLVVGSTH